MNDTKVIPLCLILPQMSSWIKYLYLKYNEIWNKIEDLLSGIKLNSDVIYDGQHIKTKVKTFSEVIKTLF